MTHALPSRLQDAATPARARMARPQSPGRSRLPPGMVLAREAGKLFGEDWPSPLARLIDVPERMLNRMAQAADEGWDYPGSAAALKRFADRLANLAEIAGREALAVRRRAALTY